MNLAEQPWVNVGVREHGRVVASFHDDATPRVQKERAPLAAQKSLRSHSAFYPRNPSSPRPTEELLRHARAAAARAGELPVVGVVRFLRGRELILVAFDGYSGDSGVELLNRAAASNEVLKGLSHVRKVAS